MIKLFNKHLFDILHLDIFMSFSPMEGTGSAYIQWVPLSRDELNLRPALICLLYARILTIHSETREKLFRIIDDISKSNVRDGGHTGFPFQEWIINIGHGAPTQHIWPWKLSESTNILEKPKVYKVTLRASSDKRDLFIIDLKMAFGQERILVPSSFFIATYFYCKTIDQQGLYELAVLLWQINEYYKSPDNISVGHESLALATAISNIRKGNLAIP